LSIRASSAVVLLFASRVSACGGRTLVISPREPISAAQLAELRVDPGPAPRDLFWGVGGRRSAPPADAVYRRIKEKIADGLALRVDRRAVADDERR